MKPAVERRQTIPAVAALLLAVTAAAGAQEALQPLDQYVADRGALSTSLRLMTSDLRQPSGFQKLYRAPGMDDMFMRADGALYAVFPRSVYARGRYGAVPVVPDGTVFYIGSPSIMASAPDATRVPATGTDERRERGGATREHRDSSRPMPYGTKLHPAPGRPRAIAPVPRRSTIVTDPSYRAARLRQLMRQAVGAGADG